MSAEPAALVVTPPKESSPWGRLLTAIFRPGQWILVRGIESFSENGRKLTKFSNKSFHSLYPTKKLRDFNSNMAALIDRAESEFLNIHFGVCPRFGGGGLFDLGWQIREVPTIWADLDHCAVDEALERVGAACLPEPSIVVNSGHGVHLYWLLDSPYLIDDVGTPPQVQKEWPTSSDGKKTCPKHFVVEKGQSIEVDAKLSELRHSDKARHIRQVIRNVGKVLGGDDVHDLSRLLRLPGFPNRKNQRNGVPPVPTELVTCEPDRRYPLSVFEALVPPVADNTRKKAQTSSRSTSKSTSTALKSAGGAPTPEADARFSRELEVWRTTDHQDRSAADFKLCCVAVEAGLDPETVWLQVQDHGKFADRGRSYFDLTWSNASQATSPKPALDIIIDVDSFDRPEESSNASTVTVVAPQPDPLRLPDGRRVLTIDSSLQVREQRLAIVSALKDSGKWFRRSDTLVVVRHHDIRQITCYDELQGQITSEIEFQKKPSGDGGDGSQTFLVLPTPDAKTLLTDSEVLRDLPRISVYSRCPVYDCNWSLTETGFNPQSGIYYAGPAIPVRTGTDHLDRLLAGFCFQTPADRTNFVGVLLTTVLIPHFIGSKPAILFNGNQPGLGKSILAQLLAIIRDGHTVETVSYNANDEEFEKRLGAVVRQGATTIIIDNAKANGRNPRIESACLERCITDPVLSFRLLGQSSSIRAENSHQFCITTNTANVSRDLVTRSVVVNLYLEGDPAKREFALANPEDYALEHRTALLGELLGMVARWRESGMPLASVNTRFNKRGWGNTLGGILHVSGYSDFLANASAAQSDFDDTRRGFEELVELMMSASQPTWTASQLAVFCRDQNLLTDELGPGSERSRATRMGGLLSRYIDEPVELEDGGRVKLVKTSGGKTTQYHLQSIAIEA